MKSQKHNKKIYKAKKSTLKQKTNVKKHLKKRTIKVIKINSMRKYKKHSKSRKHQKNNKSKKSKKKRGGMSWPAGVAIGMLTLAGLGLGAAAVGGAKQANLILKGKADDKREASGLPRKYTYSNKYSNVPQKNPSQMTFSFDTDDEDDDDDEKYGYGSNPDTTNVLNVDPQELSTTIPFQKEKPQQPFKNLIGKNYGKPDEKADMKRIYSQRQEIRSVPETTPYPPPPKVTPLQSDNYL